MRLFLILALIWIGGCSSDSFSEDAILTAPETPAISYAELAVTSAALTLVEQDTPPNETPTPTTESVGPVTGTSAPPITNTETPSTPIEIPSPTPLPATPIPFDPTMVLGVPVESVAYLPEEVIDHSQEIFNTGRALGRDNHAFSKIGDSLIANPHFLTGFDTQPYDLGDYEYLQPAVEQFAGSYERYGVAIYAGLHSWGIFDPMWADKEWCQPNETMLACEFRLNNPSILLILLGSNDSGAPDSFAFNLRKVVEFSIENGVIPIIATKADRFEGPDNTNNIILREIAAEYAIPLWDFDLVAGSIPNRGLKEDQVHLTTFDEFDYTMPEAMQRGHGVHNLTGLMVLNAIRTQVMQLQ